jgi:streptomycin 3"-adenylyltransferase
MTDALVEGLGKLLGDDLLGAYLHGSAVLGGGGPHSDVDVLAVAARRTTDEERRRMLELCRSVSLSPRPLEFDLVVASEISPWRHPAPYDFHYSELRRDGSGPGLNRDLASAVTMVLAGNTTLWGPPPAHLLGPVPRADYIDAILKDTETVDEYLPWDTRNVILTLARVWAGVGSDVVHSKESAAEWALVRLPEAHRTVLQRAVAIYRGERDDFWEDVQPQIRAYADYTSNAIRMAST